VKNEDYEAWLAFQGVGWVQRKAAEAASTVHQIICTQKKLKIQVSYPCHSMVAPAIIPSIYM
jgi:hypothetical protein